MAVHAGTSLIPEKSGHAPGRPAPLDLHGLEDWIRFEVHDSGVGIDEGLLAWWPVLIIGLSLFFLVPALFGGPNRRLRAGMVIPGAILAGAGGALLYTSLTDRWGAWASLWTVLPFSFGLGMYAAGWIADAPAFKWIGFATAVGSVVGIELVEIAVDRRGHLTFDDLLQGLPAERTVTLAPLQALRLHRLHDFKGHR